MYVKLRDISIGGIGLYSADPVKLGTFLIITLSDAQNCSWTLRARVVHVTQRYENTWILGCMFATPLGWAECEALLG
jgi:hypothetical protein